MVACTALIAISLWYRPAPGGHAGQRSDPGRTPQPGRLAAAAPADDSGGAPVELELPFQSCADLRTDSPRLVVFAPPGLATIRCRQDGMHSVLQVLPQSDRSGPAPPIRARTVEVILTYE